MRQTHATEARHLGFLGVLRPACSPPLTQSPHLLINKCIHSSLFSFSSLRHGLVKMGSGVPLMSEALQASCHFQGVSISPCANPGFATCVDIWVQGLAARCSPITSLLAALGAQSGAGDGRVCQALLPESGRHGDATPPASPSWSLQRHPYWSPRLCPRNPSLQKRRGEDLSTPSHATRSPRGRRWWLAPKSPCRAEIPGPHQPRGALNFPDFLLHRPHRGSNYVGAAIITLLGLFAPLEGMFCEGRTLLLSCSPEPPSPAPGDRAAA